MEESGTKNKSSIIRQKIILALVIAAAVAAYFVVPSYKSAIDDIVKTFASGDFTVMK